MVGLHPLFQTEKMGKKPVICRQKLLGKDTDLMNRRHEVRISFPSRQDVRMQVILNTCTRTFSHVDSDVVSGRIILLFENFFASTQKVHYFPKTLGILGGKSSAVGMRNDHQVTTCVGKSIQDDVTQSRPIEDKSVSPDTGTRKIAEDTSTISGRPGLSLDIPHSPGCA